MLTIQDILGTRSVADMNADEAAGATHMYAVQFGLSGSPAYTAAAGRFIQYALSVCNTKQEDTPNDADRNENPRPVP